MKFKEKSKTVFIFDWDGSNPIKNFYLYGCFHIAVNEKDKKIFAKRNEGVGLILYVMYYKFQWVD